MNRCRVTEERLEFERLNDEMDYQREHWENEVRMMAPDASDEDLQKYWEQNLDPTDAADQITGE